MTRVTIGVPAKLSIGVLAGAALVAAVALSPFSATGASATSASGTTSGTVTAKVTAKPVPKPVPTKKPVAPVKPVTPSPVKKTPVPTKAPAPKTGRFVTLSIPTTTTVGANVTGYIQVVDIATVGADPTPVAGVSVALQQQRPGAAFTTAADGVTDDNGRFEVAFTSRTNTTWRAVLTPAHGTVVYSSTVVTTATARLNWATRPTMAVVHGAATTYSFRISPITSSSAHLEIANAATPTKWVAAPAVVVPATTGVVSQAVTFPKSGAWLLRGATAATTNNAAGYTTTLNITVS